MRRPITSAATPIINAISGVSKRMARTVATAALSTPRNTLDSVRPQMARAEIAGLSSSIPMTEIVKDALIRHYGSLKSAAITLGMDQGQLTRELQSGDFKFKKLDLDPAAKAFVADALSEAYRHTDPRARVRRLIREARTKLDELAEELAEKSA